MIGARQVYPVINPVPVWKHGPLYDALDGRQIGEGWSVSNQFLTVVVGSALDRVFLNLGGR